MYDNKKSGNRREFFRSLCRYLTLGLLGAGGGALAARRTVDRKGQRCINKSVCCKCGAFAGCRLPAALSAKQSGVADSGDEEK